ncbi:DUF6894 family protein [Methylobacterium sp. A54F]
MPRYFFHTHVRTPLGEDVITDLNGAELGDADQAWEAARRTILATMSDPKNQERLMAASLVVTDADGAVVLEFPFAEALSLPPEDDARRH